MTDNGLEIIQFVHPGFEYSSPKFIGPKKQRSGVMPWKEGLSAHDRKFMWTQGSALDPRTNEDFTEVPLTLWGEWEGPSIYWKIDSPGKPLASIIHAPFRPANVPTTSVQNTDPMVFGDSFIYSNCRQPRHPVLRSLPSGSIILFGRLAREDGRHSFSLDTCFVADRVQQLPTIPFDPTAYGTDLVDDAALCALHSEGFHSDVGVHTGRARSGGPIFSFFPAKLAEEAPALFPRPELRPVGALEGVISPGTQATNMTHGVTASDRDAIWHEVVNQIVEQGCVLGYNASPPPLLDDDEARRAARDAPRTLKAKLNGPGPTTPVHV